MASLRFAFVLCALLALGARSIRRTDTEDVQTVAYDVESTGPVNCESFPDVPRYRKWCNHTCAARSISTHSWRSTSTVSLHGRVEQCRSSCADSPRCNCFVLTERLCSLGLTESRKVKKSRSKGAQPFRVAYAFEEDESYEKVLQVADTSELPLACRAGQTGHLNHQPPLCSHFFACSGGHWINDTCPVGSAFSAQRGRCDWPEAVTGCEHLATQPLRHISCGDKELLLAPGVPGVQELLRTEMDEWWKNADAEKGWHSRPEGEAARAILRTAGIEVVDQEKFAVTALWGLFSRGEDGLFTMQAIALVRQEGGDFDIMAIVSRRSLLNDAASVSGAGKALLAGIMQHIHEEDIERPLTLYGTPGDEFVKKLYIQHGMVEVGGASANGMPKLKMAFPAGCVDFVKDNLLCRETPSAKDLARVAWRLIPGSGWVKETCAHLIPVHLYLQQLGKVVGLAL